MDLLVGTGVKHRSVENRVNFSSFTEYWTLMSMLVVVLNMFEKKVKRDQPVLKR